MKAGNLFFTGCRQERGAEPVRSCLAGSADCGADGSRFLRWQPNRKDINGRTLLRQPRTPHFLFHKIFLFRVRKCLTRYWTFVYKCPVSNFEAAPFQQSARTSLERLVTSDTRLEPGRAKKRLAMKAETIQVRSLAIETTGDFFHGKIIPRIRIAGQWLEQAGFKPGHRVEVSCDQPGSLTLRFLEQAQEVAL